MKKLFIALTAIVLGISAQAQVLKVYKDGNLVQSIKSSEGNKFVFEEEPETEDAHDYVDMGLPSGTLWATCNVGADSPEEYGDYFAWGETTPQSDNSYSWSSYKWCNGSENTITKYCTTSTYSAYGSTYDRKSTLEAADDAATVNWGSKWKMPSNDQIAELFNSTYTTTAFTTHNGVKGFLIISKNTGNTLFMPASGYRANGELSINLNFYCTYYWSSDMVSSYSSLGATTMARCMEADCSPKQLSGQLEATITNRCRGAVVRPVRVLE